MSQVDQPGQVADSVGTIRAVAYGFQLTDVPPAVLVAGLIAGGDARWVDPLLVRHGVSDPVAIRRAITGLVDDEGDEVCPAVKMGPGLSSELKERLGQLRDGQPGSAEAALEDLLSRRRDDELLWLFRDPDDFCRNYRGEGSRPYDRSGLVRRLARFYGPRLNMANQFLRGNFGDDGIAALARKGVTKRFRPIAEHLFQQREEMDERVFSHPLYVESPFGEVWTEHGEFAAHVFGMVMLPELGLIVTGIPTVREVAAAISPKSYIRQLGLVQEAVSRRLRPDWVVLPTVAHEYVRLDSSVLPSEEAVDRMCAFLADEPISNDEMDDILLTIT